MTKICSNGIVNRTFMDTHNILKEFTISRDLNEWYQFIIIMTLIEYFIIANF